MSVSGPGVLTTAPPPRPAYPTFGCWTGGDLWTGGVLVTAAVSMAWKANDVFKEISAKGARTPNTQVPWGKNAKQTLKQPA